MAVTFEGMERRMPKIEKCLAEYGIANLEEARKICNDLGFDPYDIVKGVQPIAFENAGWAYTLGCAVAVKKGHFRTIPRTHARQSYSNKQAAVK